LVYIRVGLDIHTPVRDNGEHVGIVFNIVLAIRHWPCKSVLKWEWNGIAQG